MTEHDGLTRPSGARVEGPVKSSNGEWFWRRYAANGERVAGPVETVRHRQHAQDQAIEEALAFNLRLFHPGFDSDGTEDAEHWIEVDPLP
jgi:hypothetical protein